MAVTNINEAQTIVATVLESLSTTINALNSSLTELDNAALLGEVGDWAESLAQQLSEHGVSADTISALATVKDEAEKAREMVGHIVTEIQQAAQTAEQVSDQVDTLQNALSATSSSN